MIGRLNHVAIAVPSLEAAAQVYRGLLGATVSEAVPQPEHGVSTIFVELPNTKIELLEPLGADPPIRKFLDRNPEGGIHHICYEVDDIRAALAGLAEEGAELIDAEPRTGLFGLEVAFVHPDSLHGVLTEMVSAHG